MRATLWALAAVLLLLGVGTGRAERLVLSVSQPEVRITSSFAGAELVLFGVVDPDIEAHDLPDVVVTVRGPRQTFTTWRKTRVLGIWVNSDSRTFLEVPAFLAVLSSRPTAQMADPDTLRAAEIGLARNLFVQRVGADFADTVPDDPFRAAFLRIQSAHGLYAENAGGVSFLAPDVFRSEIAIPGTAPLGRYEVEVEVLRGGRVRASAATFFHVEKTGFEQQITEFSQHDGLLYGLAVALFSLVVGFCGNLLFRRE